jgi:hypothetical protein
LRTSARVPFDPQTGETAAAAVDSSEETCRNGSENAEKNVASSRIYRWPLISFKVATDLWPSISFKVATAASYLNLGASIFFFFAITTTSNYQWTAGFHAFYDSSIASRV